MQQFLQNKQSTSTWISVLASIEKAIRSHDHRYSVIWTAFLRLSVSLQSKHKFNKRAIHIGVQLLSVSLAIVTYFSSTSSERTLTLQMPDTVEGTAACPSRKNLGLSFVRRRYFSSAQNRTTRTSPRCRCSWRWCCPIHWFFSSSSSSETESANECPGQPQPHAPVLSEHRYVLLQPRAAETSIEADGGSRPALTTASVWVFAQVLLGCLLVQASREREREK